MAGQKPLPPLPPMAERSAMGRASLDSESTVSATSLLFERISERVAETEKASGRMAGQRRRGGGGGGGDGLYDNDMNEMGDMGERLSDLDDEDPLRDDNSADYDLETGPFLGRGRDGDRGDGLSMTVTAKGGYTKMDKGMRRVLVAATVVFVLTWVGGLFVYIAHESYLHGSEFEHDPSATASRGNLRKVTREQLDSGLWSPRFASIQWIAGPDGEDGLLRETGLDNQPYLVVEDVRSLGEESQESQDSQKREASQTRRTLVEAASFRYDGMTYDIATAVPSQDMKKVLLGVQRKSNWRHSATAVYFVMDVASQTVQPLVAEAPTARVQLAQWSPNSDAIAFTRDNNLYVRTVAAGTAQITTDGGAELFYGVPDWVYEEEVLSGASATWWSPDGRYIAFLRTNETGVPSYPVQYFVSRPSGTEAAPGEENYPEVRQIKYPKAGAHNPVVDLQFYDVTRGDVFSVAVSGDFADDNRLMTTVLWAGAQKVVVKETNRVSNVMRVVVVDVAARTGQAVRTVDVGALDGGWFEISQRTRYVPADAARQRPDDGYVDTVIHNDGDHLAYFTPPENPEPIMLTTGPDWEVADAPSAVDLERNLVYFAATKAGSTQRHIYSVGLRDGQNLTAVTNTDEEGYYTASFSTGAGYMLLDYRGPGIPWQKVKSTAAAAEEAGDSTPFEHTLEDNRELATRARQHALPLLVYGTLQVGTGDEAVELNYVERRPPHFDANKRYPVLFQQYSGPGSQEVKKQFRVDFQAYAAAALGCVVVTVDPRGTGFRGRQFRVPVRGQLGVVEAQDHIAAARHWAGLSYVDAQRLAIWGWSYGGFMTLKTLEQDAGQTFRYGVAVAPVTDWRFYDSIYTERYMDTPQANAAGYDASAVRNASALAQNERFLIMHGVGDDNVHFQNSLALLDRLDLEGAANYDVHVFPDSDHGIYFHGANKIVYDKLENFLVNAFNGEWIKVGHAKPGKK